MAPMKVLLLCEAVTLAHSARVAVLARGLAERGHQVTVAGAAAIARFEHPRVTWRELGCIGAERFVRALALGTAPYTEADLQRYVDEERRCIESVGPDVVAADFRPTVAVSARRAGVPCAAIVNAYWSPAATGPLPMPVLPFTRVLPLPVAQRLFDLGSRWVLPLHARPWNRVRTAHGLGDLGPDLRRIYCDADAVLYPDIPGMFALGPLPAHHHFIGPLLWSPTVPRPSWWGEVAPRLPGGPPLAYVTLGSSGDPRLLGTIVAGLVADGFQVMATAPLDTATRLGRHPGVFAAPYLPGDAATALADIVVCNGGAMTCHQAFEFGKPVLGIAGNMDQVMNMRGVIAEGAGIAMRADRVTVGGMRRAATALRDGPSHLQASRALGERMRAIDACDRLEHALAAQGRGADDLRAPNPHPREPAPGRCPAPTHPD